MSVTKDTTGKWMSQVRVKDYTGKTIHKKKRGFATKKEALEWERGFLNKATADVGMLFQDFVDLYFEDMGHRLKESTIISKRYMVDKKILPVFGKMPINEITPKDIRKWQNRLTAYRDENGKPYAQTYLKTINNQLTAMFNYAVKYYDLRENPCTKAGSMGKSQAEEMQFWTKAEFEQFIPAVQDKPASYAAFMTLYYTGMRVGDADGKISLNQQKPSKHAGLRRFGPEKFLQRNNEFMKERPIFYKKPIKTEKDFSTWLRCFYYTTKAVITEYIYF